jgi:hypothetical protein
MGLQQARHSFVSFTACDETSALRGRFQVCGGLRPLSQLSAVDQLNTGTSSSVVEESRKEEIEEFLRRHDIHVSNKSAPQPVLRFEESSLPKHLLNMVLSQFSAPTPIQAQARDRSR